MKQWIKDSLNLLFPPYCPVCGFPVNSPPYLLCMACESGLPKTGFEDLENNPVAELFWGRVDIQYATSLFQFEKGSDYQVLLHRLKYNGAKRLGHYLGKLLGHSLKHTPLDTYTSLVPVPLHPRKERKRGYNQSTLIAQGVSDILHIPVESDLLIRKSHTESQTNKGRLERFLNLEGVIALNETIRPGPGARILLIDDVVTTGSTLEACTVVLTQFEDVKISIATLACA